jgi:hypothetical protein
LFDQVFAYVVSKWDLITENSGAFFAVAFLSSAGGYPTSASLGIVSMLQ